MKELQGLLSLCALHRIMIFPLVHFVHGSCWNFLHLAALITLFNQDMQMNQQKH